MTEAATGGLLAGAGLVVALTRLAMGTTGLPLGLLILGASDCANGPPQCGQEAARFDTARPQSGQGRKV